MLPIPSHRAQGLSSTAPPPPAAQVPFRVENVLAHVEKLIRTQGRAVIVLAEGAGQVRGAAGPSRRASVTTPHRQQGGPRPSPPPPSSPRNPRASRLNDAAAVTRSSPAVLAPRPTQRAMHAEKAATEFSTEHHPDVDESGNVMLMVRRPAAPARQLPWRDAPPLLRFVVLRRAHASPPAAAHRTWARG